MKKENNMIKKIIRKIVDFLEAYAAPKSLNLVANKTDTLSIEQRLNTEWENEKTEIMLPNLNITKNI